MSTLPTVLPKQYEVIGVFSDKNLQSILDKAGAELAEGESGLIAHINGESANLTVVKRFGDHISVEAVLDYNYSLSKFSGEAELKAIF